MGEGWQRDRNLSVRQYCRPGQSYLFGLAMKNVQLVLPRASSLIHVAPIKLSRDINLPLVCTYAGEYNFQMGLTSNSRLFFPLCHIDDRRHVTHLTGKLFYDLDTYDIL